MLASVRCVAMNALSTALKSEIARVARKELKSELSSLRAIATAHRSEIASLKRELRSLRSHLKSTARAVKSVSASSASDEPSPRKQIRFSADGFAAMREKWGISQAQMAALLSASSLSVHKWESGKVRPRVAQLERIQAVRRLGKREVMAQLAKG